MFKQKEACEFDVCDWGSGVLSSDLNDETATFTADSEGEEGDAGEEGGELSPCLTPKFTRLLSEEEFLPVAGEAGAGGSAGEAGAEEAGAGAGEAGAGAGAGAAEAGAGAGAGAGGQDCSTGIHRPFEDKALKQMGLRTLVLRLHKLRSEVQPSRFHAQKSTS